MTTSLRARFDALAATWEAHVHDSRAASNPRVFVEHPSFDGIVELGRAHRDEVVALIIERYRKGSLFWGAALARITGNTSFGDGLGGNLKATRDKWLAWSSTQPHA